MRGPQELLLTRVNGCCAPMHPCVWFAVLAPAPRFGPKPKYSVMGSGTPSPIEESTPPDATGPTIPMGMSHSLPVSARRVDQRKNRGVVAFFLSCFCVLCLTTSMPLTRACGAFAFWFDSVVVVQAQPSVLASKHVSGASPSACAVCFWLWLPVHALTPRTNFCCVCVCLRSTVARQVLAQSSHPSKRARSNTCDCHDRRQRWQCCARRPQ